MNREKKSRGVGEKTPLQKCKRTKSGIMSEIRNHSLRVGDLPIANGKITAHQGKGVKTKKENRRLITPVFC